MHSQIRHSQIADLSDKVHRQDYGAYLSKISIEKLRGFENVSIEFDFPVTAIIGPNGSGKSSVLGAAACAYRSIKPGLFFPKSAIGDDSMAGWKIEYELVQKNLNARQSIRRSSSFKRAKWVRGDVVDRPTVYFGIERTVPAGEKPRFKKLMRSTYQHRGGIDSISPGIAEQVEKILGKSISQFQVADLSDDSFFVGSTEGTSYSEFHFGAGESSIIRMVAAIEAMEENSLVLIEEIENGLHPVATSRMVEYLMDVAERKRIQAIFTTHSDHAIGPLPNGAIWACINSKLQQGKLSIEALRAVTGRVDKAVAIFCEDEFAKSWIEAIVRAGATEHMPQIGVYSVAGDGNALATHRSHQSNPAITTASFCLIDGDSRQDEDRNSGVWRLPGDQPEIEVFNSVFDNLDQDVALFTVACQNPAESQGQVSEVLEQCIRTNRDPHILFSQIGIELGFVSETIVRGAFFSIWLKRNQEFVNELCDAVKRVIDEH